MRVLWKVLGIGHALLLIPAAHLGGSSPFLSDVPNHGMMLTQVSLLKTFSISVNSCFVNGVHMYLSFIPLHKPANILC